MSERPVIDPVEYAKYFFARLAFTRDDLDLASNCRVLLDYIDKLEVYKLRVDRLERAEWFVLETLPDGRK